MSEASNSYPKPRVLAILLGLCGLLLASQGAELIGVGGSFYYLLAGVVLLAVAVLLFRGDKRGAQLYGGFLLFTYLWAFYEVGLDAWQLMPRVAMFTVLGLWFLLPRVRRGLWKAEPQPLLQQRTSQLVLGAFAVFTHPRGKYSMPMLRSPVPIDTLCGRPK